MHRAQSGSRSLLLPAVAGLIGLLAGCSSTVTPTGQPNPDTMMPPGTTPPGGTGGAPPTISTACAQELPAAKRIVRISFNQIANSIGALLDSALGTKIVTDFELVDSEHRAFPPLQSPREGNSLTDQSWSTIDKIAEAAGKHVAANFMTATPCGAAPTDDCAQQYLNGLAQKVYRHPLSAGEQTRLTGLYTSLKAAGTTVTVNQAVEQTIYALFQTPQFLYRTEFGTDWKADGSLTSFELASMLSYFLTDNTPDSMLFDAAAQNKLSNATEIGAQVDRIMATDAAKTNFQGAMFSYFSYPNLENVVIQDADFVGAMRSAMYHEASLFLKNNLWGPQLNELILSRKGYINATLAPIYGLTFPAGGTPDADGFAQIELPANRTGLLAQAGFLANRSRPDGTSVVGRGLLIKGALLCTETPSPPEGVTEKIEMINAANPNASEREMAEIRATTNPCNTCHASFDAYGLALDTFDVLGRYREKDAAGRTIDPAVTLPVEVGGGTAANIVEVANKLASSGAFAKCMGMNLINYALADVSSGAANISSCAADEVAKTFSASPDQSFSSLVKSVAVSAAFSSRSKGSEGVTQ